MYINNFNKFLNEGAVLNNTQTGVIISFEKFNGSHEFVETSTESNFHNIGSDLKFKVYYGLNAVSSGKNKKEDQILTKIFKYIKDGKFTVVTKPKESDLDKDIPEKSSIEDLSNPEQFELFEFMADTGNFPEELDYVVYASSKSPLVNIMADVIQQRTDAKLIKLNKKEYTNIFDIITTSNPSTDKIKRDPMLGIEKLPNIRVKGGEIINTQEEQKILIDYLTWVAETEKNKEALKALDKLTAENILKTLGRTESKWSIDLINGLLKHFSTSPDPIILNTDYNHARSFLKEKYDYTEEFIDAVKNCLDTQSNKKMVIIDDNIQSNTDFREILRACNHVVKFLRLSSNVSQSAESKIKQLKKELWTAKNPNAITKQIEKITLESKINTNNIFGYVLYKRPLTLKDDRNVPDFLQLSDEDRDREIEKGEEN